MSKYILHVGAHKTGTSTIQDSLINNIDELNAFGLYPLLGSDSLDIPLWKYLEGGVSVEWDLYFSRDNCTFLISNEGISLYGYDQLAHIKKKFSGFAKSEIQVHYFIRDPEGFKNSDCKQIIRSLGGGVNQVYNGNTSIRYYDIPLKLDTVFGVDSVFLHYFNDAVENGLFKYFMRNCVGCDLDLKEYRSNSSVSDMSLMLYSLLYDRGYKPSQFFRVLINAMKGVSDIKFNILESEVSDIDKGIEYLKSTGRKFDFCGFSYRKENTEFGIDVDLFELLKSLDEQLGGFERFVDPLKKAARELERKSDLEGALQLYLLAKYFRPDGTYINKKIRDLSNRLSVSCSVSW